MTALDAAFYFDLGSPLAYLAAERVLHVLGGRDGRDGTGRRGETDARDERDGRASAPIHAEWQPVLARELPGAETFEAFRCREEEDIFRVDIARRAREHRLQPLRWPNPFPFDSALAMRAATYAKSIGRTVPFAQAAFRQAFAGGRSLGEPDNVLIAAAACEMHPAAVMKGTELASVRARLEAATAAAAQIGVSDVPAVRIGEQIFIGERCLVEAAAHMSEAARIADPDGAISVIPARAR